MTREELNDTLLKAAMKARYEKAFDIIKGEQVDSIKLTQIMIDAILEALPSTFLDADAEVLENDVVRYSTLLDYAYTEVDDEDDFTALTYGERILQRAGNPVYQFDKEISK